MKASSTLPATALPADAPMGVAWMPIAAFCFLWSSAFAAAKIAVRDCPPLTLLTIRFLIAGALMLGVAAASGRWQRPSGRDLASLVLLGMLNNAAYLGLSWSGMTTVSSACLLYTSCRAACRSNSAAPSSASPTRPAAKSRPMTCTPSSTANTSSRRPRGSW